VTFGRAGEWVPDKPQQEQRCVPIKGVELKADGSLGGVGNSSLWSERASDMTNAMDTLLRGGRRNVRSAYVMAKLGVPIMNIWNQTVPFWDFHRSLLFCHTNWHTALPFEAPAKQLTHSRHAVKGDRPFEQQSRVRSRHVI